jgi:TetR/AcrR family transcriptional regulator, mexJK operon transcriptional repressor
MSIARVNRTAGSGDFAVSNRVNTQRAAARSKEEEVLDTAADYFLTHGYEGTSISAMARSSGISKESIYRYFSGKRELFEAVMERELSLYHGHLRKPEREGHRPATRDALLEVAETILRLITSERTLALRRVVFAESGRIPDVGIQYWRIGPQSAFEKLEDIFRSHDRELAFDARVLAQYFLALLTHRIMLERICGLSGPPTREQVVDYSQVIVDDFMRAFLAA